MPVLASPLSYDPIQKSDFNKSQKIKMTLYLIFWPK